MRFESRDFKLAKDAGYPDENQDAFRADADRGIAAIADGVASGIFARRWAQILTEATVSDPPDLDDKAAFGAWLAVRREAWSAGIDASRLAWFQKPKLRQGAFSTLLWVEITPLDDEDRQPHDPWRLRARAVGDSCLFHVRGAELLRAFPVEKAAQLEADPVVIGSVDLKRDELLAFQSYEALCRPGDLLVLCTDAVADWALREHEAGRPPVWEEYWGKTEQAWQEEVTALRSRRQMRYDDATLLLLRVTDGVTVPKEPRATVAAPLPDAPAQPDWARKLKSFSEQFADQVSEQVARGMKKLKEVKESAESAIKKYRDKRGSEDGNDHGT